ncbi:MAG: hypothetical protein V3W34_06565 [Phycisphaerae bacterium]
MDATLLRKAIETVASIDLNDPVNTAIHMSALSGTVLWLWESAAESSEHHQDILAALENAVRYCRDLDCPTSEQIDAIREALIYLAQPTVVREQAKVVRERFVDEGIGALAFLDKAGDNEDSHWAQ